jgi:hypothetical protein
MNPPVSHMAVALISVFSGLERTLGIFRRANFNSSGVAARRPRHDPRSALAIAGAGLQPEWQRHGMLAILARAASASTDPDRAVALAIAGAGLQPEWQRHGMLAILRGLHRPVPIRTERFAQAIPRIPRRQSLILRRSPRCPSNSKARDYFRAGWPSPSDGRRLA